MGRLISYLKRGFKYIISEHKQPIIKVEAVQKKPSEVFKDKVFIITGGGSGIGYQIAKRLIDENAKCIITGRNEEKLIEAQKKLGNHCDFMVLDMTNVENFDSVIKEILKKYNRIDGLINNAGISLHEWDFMKVNEEKFDSQFLTNLRGGYFLTQSYIKHCIPKENERYKILFISSERGTYVDDLPYGLTKASINSLAKALSVKYYKKGFNINVISPGVTATEMTKISKDSDLYSNENSQRYFIPEEISEVALFLLSDYSICISGEVVHTNGGNHIRRGY